MTEERITEVETPSGNVHTSHTVVTEDRGRSGGAGWLIALVLVAVAAIAIYLFSQRNQSEIAENAAVAEAAESVSDAASEVGEAAQNAGEAAEDAVDGQ